MILICAQSGGGVQSPIRMIKHFAGECYEIGLPGGDGVVTSLRVPKKSNRHGSDPGIPANSICERDLETLRNAHSLWPVAATNASAGTIDHVDPGG